MIRVNNLQKVYGQGPGATHALRGINMEVRPGEFVTVASRRGDISLYARADEGTPLGTVVIAFAYHEAAANKLTNPALDPYGKIPEFKYCAVRVTKGGKPPVAGSFGGGKTAQDVLAGL